MDNFETLPRSRKDQVQEYTLRRWDTLVDGERVELGLLQVDIVGHSDIVGSDLTLEQAKDRFRDELERIALRQQGRIFSWAGDGGCFMFLIGDGRGFNTLVRAAIDMLESLPAINQDLQRGTDLQEDLRVRISCDYGTARYRDPSKIHARFINSFFKHEKWISEPDRVCITERVRNQLNSPLRERFEFLRYSAELNIDLYQLIDKDSKNKASPTESFLQAGPYTAGHPQNITKKRGVKYPSWVFVLPPLLCVAVVLVWPIEESLAGLVVVPVTLVLSILISLHKSKYESSLGQSLFRSLLKDELLPNETGGPLVFDAKVVVIADISEKGSFLRSLEKEFERVDESTERNLTFVQVTCDELDPKKQKASLHCKLEAASAVVVVRTKELEFKNWLYEYIDTWAYQRSEIPIVFTELDPRYRKSQIPERYFSIPPQARSLPWRLLQRAHERGSEWRGVARYNRVAVGACVMIAFTSAFIVIAMLPRQKRERLELVKKHFDYTAVHLKTDYIRLLERGDTDKNVPIPSDSELQVSYWFNFENEARQFASTEDRPKYMPFGFNKSSAIGTAFVLGNSVTEGDVKNIQSDNRIPIRIWKDDVHVDDPEAFLHQESYRTIKSIVCASHTGTPETDRTYTVGVCVFTETDKPIFRNEYRSLLRDAVRKLFQQARPHIERKEITPLPK